VVELRVRPMGVEDLDVRIRYFQDATDEHLQLIGVDRSKLLALGEWRRSFEEDLARPVAARTDHGLIWEADGEPVGFSTADRIVFGDQAYMHLRSRPAAAPATGPGRGRPSPDAQRSAAACIGRSAVSGRARPRW